MKMSRLMTAFFRVICDSAAPKKSFKIKKKICQKTICLIIRSNSVNTNL